MMGLFSKGSISRRPTHAISTCEIRVRIRVRVGVRVRVRVRPELVVPYGVHRTVLGTPTPR